MCTYVSCSQVTGGSKGIGLVTAQLLLDLGAEVAPLGSVCRPCAPRLKFREFRDVAFEHVGAENDSLLTLDNRRCGDFTPSS